MSLKKPKSLKPSWFPTWILVMLSLTCLIKCQDLSDYDQISNPALRPLITQMVNDRLANLTHLLNDDLSRRASFCIKDTDADWNKAFNFSTNLDFLASCIEKTRGDITRRLCTAAEIKLYFNGYFQEQSGGFLGPNRNCNLTTWVSGCEPGWACSVGRNEPVDLQQSGDIPVRTRDCQSCCDGFFCPSALTCMIPCPLGSYCPSATLNAETGICDPYNYKLPVGRNHTCGGANIWADLGRSREVFCSGGSYCPSTVKENTCSSGYYCRMGSVSEKRCFKLTSCDPNTASQNMHAYGVMLLAALATVLLIIYNCFDQVLTTRERRLSKSREAAARSARETAKARQRWRTAKDAAKKHAHEFQSQVSRTFSRKRSIEHPEKLKILNEFKAEIGDVDDLYSSSYSSASYYSSTSSEPSKEKQNDMRDPMHKIHEIENDFDSHSFNIEKGDAKTKGHPSKGKHMSTNSQIFKYAYDQLEKEKALQQENKDLTFSGVISMATNAEVKKRPQIEVSFKDLTLTLKAKKQHLLRCVTGNIRPGRITAVMGPSGAGKTTFLSAVAGKTFACKMTGLILVNGKNEPIQSYKKIIGFVPQDDIV